MSVNGHGGRHASAATLGDALALIAGLQATDIKKRDFKSAVMTTARWVKSYPTRFQPIPWP